MGAEGPLDMQVVQKVATVRPQSGVALMLAPTMEQWAMTNRMVVAGATVEVRLIGDAEGQKWALVHEAGCMEAWVPSHLLEFQDMGEAAPTQPITPPGGFN